MRIQDLICCCCGGVAIVLLGGFASFGEDPHEPARVELLLSGDDSAIGIAGQQLISSTEDWQALWARHLGPDATDPDTGEVSPASPEVDFEQQLVVAVFVGRGRTAFGLKLSSYTSEADQLTIRYKPRWYQTTGRGLKSSRMDPAERKREREERYGYISPYGFFLLSRGDRTIMLFEDTQPLIGVKPVWTERARFTPPELQPAER